MTPGDETTRPKAADIVKRGGVIAFRSDTFYGLGADPFNSIAVDRIKELKGREDDKPILLLISSLRQLPRLIKVRSKAFEVLAQAPTFLLAALLHDPVDAEVARAVNKVGRLQQRLGDLAGARIQFENEVATHRQLLRADPQQMTWKRRLASSLAYLAVVRSILGDTAGGLACAEEELGIDRELATRDPENVEWERNLAVASWRVADLLRTRGDTPRGLDLASQASATIKRAIVTAPARQDWINELGGIDTTYARLVAATGQTGRAETLLLANINRLKSKGDADTPTWLAEAWFELGELQRARGDRAAATKSWTNAYDAMREIGPLTTATRPAALWVRILARLGRIDESRSTRAKLREMGYQNPDLEQVCNEEGC